MRLLEAGEMVCVYPGGIDDSFKLSSEAYTLEWGARRGFARVAMQARVPVLPIAATGVDELFEVRRREQVIGQWFGGAPRYDVPVPENLLPRRIPLAYHVLEAIDTSGDPADEAAVERVRRATLTAMESVIDPYRARLRGGAGAAARKIRSTSLWPGLEPYRRAFRVVVNGVSAACGDKVAPMPRLEAADHPEEEGRACTVGEGADLWVGYVRTSLRCVGGGQGVA